MIKQFLISNFKFSSILKIILCLIFNFALLTLNLGEAHAQTPPNLSDYIWNIPPVVASSSVAPDLRQKLTNEIEKMIQDKNNDGVYDHVVPFILSRVRTVYREIYFLNPAETLLTLSTAYPYVPQATQTKIRAFLASEMVAYPPSQIDFCSVWGNSPCLTQGNRREYATVPVGMLNNYCLSNNEMGQTGACNPEASLENLYGLWAYGYYLGEWSYLQAHYNETVSIYNKFKSVISNNPANIKYLTQIGGLIGFARIAKQFSNNPGDPNDILAQEAAGYAIAAMQTVSAPGGFTTFRRNSENKANFPSYFSLWETDPYFYSGHPFVLPLFYYDFSYGTTISYMTLFPKEIGQFLRDYSAPQTEVRDFVSKVEAFEPGWELTKSGQSVSGEGFYHTPDVKWTIFKLKAYTLGESQEQLRKYLDVPASMGDLFYIQELIATIESPSTGVPTPTPAPSCTLTGASWSAGNVVSGTPVTLTVNGSNCDGQTVNFLVRENDSILEGGIDEDASSQPSPNTAVFSSNTASIPWTATYMQDGLLGVFDPPEYYFNATVGTQNIRSADPLLTVTQAVTPTPTPTPAPISNNDWPQLQRDAQRTGYSPVQINPNYSLKWKWNTLNNASIRSSMKTQPVAAGGRVFFGSYDGKMYAIDTNTTGGNEAPTLWTYQTNGSIFNSAAVDNNLVFFGSDDGYFYAVSADTGALSWKYPTGSGIWSAPLVASGTVYFGSRDGYFYALNQSNGSLVWRYDTKAPILNSAAYSAKQNTVYFGSENMNAYGLDATTGALKWQKKLYGESFRDSWPVVHEANDIVFFTTMAQYPMSDQLGDGVNQLSTTSLTTELANLRQYYTNNPTRQTFFALDSVTGNNKFSQPIPISWTGGGGGTFAAPTINRNNEIFVVTRSATNTGYSNSSNWPDGRCCAVLGKLDPAVGDVSILSPVSSLSLSFRLIADESSWLSLSGNKLMVSMSESLGQIDVTSGIHAHIIHERNPLFGGVGYPNNMAIFQAPDFSKYSTDKSYGHVAPPYAPAIVANGVIIWRADGGALAGVAGQ